MNDFLTNRLIEIALQEDIGRGDISSNALKSFFSPARFVFKAKEDFTLCGTAVASSVMLKINNTLKVKWLKNDGDILKCNEVFGYVEGDTASILIGERTSLNFIQRLSGITTNTKRYVDAVDNPKIKILDTRKTIPGHRILEKYAVKTGGGYNHRFGLYDGVMLKDNHIDAAGSITRALNIVKENTPSTVKIEVETRNLKEVEEAANIGADIIMLDNFNFDDIKSAIGIINKRAKVEVSGGININNISKYKFFDIDYISIGSLTHQAVSVDISLKYVETL